MTILCPNLPGHPLLYGFGKSQLGSFPFQGASQIKFCYHKTITLHPIPMQSHSLLRHDYVIFR